MYIAASTVDDLMNDVLKMLLSSPFNIKATRGKISEATGILLCLENPLARLSRSETKGTPFSALGELLWYLSKDNDLEFIKYYIPEYKKESEDEKTVYGGYGPRLFNSQGKYDQIANIIKLLKSKSSSRRAVIQLFEARDIDESRCEIPCTCSLQFIIRDNLLNMITYMRSNDAYIGLPHDVFAFTMLQEIIARSVGVEIGTYKHCVGSLHLYAKNEEAATQYLAEGYQSTKKPMPPMPPDDPWSCIKVLLDVECKIRNGKDVKISDLALHAYWLDLARLLQIHSLAKKYKHAEIQKMQEEFSNRDYDSYIEKRVVKSQKMKRKK